MFVHQEGLSTPGLIVMFTMSLLLAACGSDKSQPQDMAANPENYQGYWVADAYGEAMAVTSTSVTVYQFNQGYCLLASQRQGNEADLVLQSWQLSDDQTQLSQVLDYDGLYFHQPVFSQATALPELCQDNNLTLSAGQSGYQFDPLQEFDLFWQTFADYYPAFERRQLDWQAQRALIEPELAASSNHEELFVALARLIEPLQDPHISVRYADNDYSNERPTTLIQRLTDEYLQDHDEPDSNSSWQAYLNWLANELEIMENIRRSYATSTVTTAANDQLIWYRVDADDRCSGVLQINSMLGYSVSLDLDHLTPAMLIEDLETLEAGMEQALTDLASCDHLVLDLRTNGGGFDAASQLVARHFLDAERLLYSKQARLGSNRTELEEIRLQPLAPVWLQPVTILTSTNTTSAAEVLALAMLELPQVKIIGERSQGALADIVSKELPSGIGFDLVNEYYLSASGVWYEGLGVPVSEEIEFATVTQRQAGRDLALEAALF